MKSKKNLINALKSRELNTQTTVAIIAGLTIGVAIGALFSTEKGKELKKNLIGYAGDLINNLTGNTPAKAHAKLGSLIGDVRTHIKLNAEGLLENRQEYRMKDPMLIDQ